MQQYQLLARELGVTFNFSLLTASNDNKVFKDYLLDKEEFMAVQEYLKRENIPIMDTAFETIGLQCKNRCGAGKNLVSIAADGTVYPCHMLHIPQLSLGNIFEMSLEEIVYNVNNQFLNINVDLMNGCNSCKYKYFCGGGCGARSYLSTGSIYERCDLCETNYKFIEDNFNDLKKLCANLARAQ